VVDERRLGEPQPAVHDPVPDRDDRLGVHSRQHGAQRRLVRGRVATGLADPLDQAARRGLLAAEHPVLHRRRAAVEHQDVLHRCPLGSSIPACAAVMAPVLTMSRTLAPRDRSLTGLRSPCRIAPTATAPAERCTALYVLLPVFRSGKINTVARPATGLPGSLVAATDGTTAASYWIGPST